MNQATAHQIIRTVLADIEVAASRLAAAAILVEGLAPELGWPPVPVAAPAKYPPSDVVDSGDVDDRREWRRTVACANGAVASLAALTDVDLAEAISAIENLSDLEL